VALFVLGFGLGRIFADDFKLTDGREYKGVTVTRAEPDGIMVMTDSGIEKIPFSLLPKEVQTKYGYDPQKAAQFQAEEKAVSIQRLAVATQQTVAADAAKQAKEEEVELARKAKLLNLEIDQVIPGGIMATLTEEDYLTGGGISYSDSGGKPIFVKGVTGKAEGEQMFALKAYRDGTYTYSDTQGASRTVEKWILVK
jgi:hypothetical protein